MKVPGLVVPIAIACASAGQRASPEPPPSSELLRYANGANDAFAAIGRFQGARNCTGAVVDPSGLGDSNARAWFLTAGHCISLEPYGVIRNQPSTATVQLKFFVDTTPEARVTLRSRSVGWSTMKGLDLGLVELDATLGDLSARGIRPLRVASAAPEAGQAVFWAGISGAPIPAEMQFVRRGNCTLGKRAQLLERSWIWNNALSNDCPDLYAGASGSPLFDAKTNEVIGVISTSTLLNVENGPDYDCQLNRPCVIGGGEPVVEKDTSYAAAAHGITPCFDQANTLDLQRPGCLLDPGLQLAVQSGATEVRPEVDGKPATWDAAMSGSQRYYAYKHFRAGEGDCSALSGYSSTVALATAPVITDRIGQRDGYYFLCVIAGNTTPFDATWQQPSHASMRFKRLDSQPPVVVLDYEIQVLQNAYRLVYLTGADGTSGLGLGFTKRGPPSVTDCSNPQDYRVQISIPPIVRTSDMPDRICSKISDRAGNVAEPIVFDFGAPALLPNAVASAASRVRGRVAPGSNFHIDTFNLTAVTEFSATPVPTLAGVRMWVLDAASHTIPVEMTVAGPLFVEAVMPDTAAPGPATLVVQPPQSSRISQPVSIGRTAPGLYPVTGIATPSGFASGAGGELFPLATCQDSGSGCYTTRLPLSSTKGGLDFVVYATGLRASRGSVKVRIGTHTLNSVEVRLHPLIAGVDELHFHLASDFPLRLYQTIAAETPEGTSNYLWIYLE